MAEGKRPIVVDICFSWEFGLTPQATADNRESPTGESHTVECQEYVCLFFREITQRKHG